jgi:Domain of unknown function (DUF4333)
MRRLLVVVSVAVTAGAVLCGCSVSASVGGATVSAAKLQDDISSKLEKAGKKPQSVTCHGDLKGEPGATTDCTIVTDDNTFEGHVTATKVDGDTISYTTSPSLTKDQLEKAVTDIEVQQNNLEVTAATCKSGLDGIEGKTADCTVEASGDSADIVVTVEKVDGLLMSLDIKAA